jgi:XTP/dITP diphosphohydrolase
MKKRILIATSNSGKLREIKELLKDLPAEFLSINDFPDTPEVEEDGYSYTENALKKAAVYSSHTSLPTIAEDSGLEVEALNGMPGMLSARYAGFNASDAERIAKLLREMNGIPEEKRRARYVCSAVFATPEGERYISEGKVEGIILTQPRGTAGFGYDPVFFVPEYKMTMAELPLEIKNKISHRARAILPLKDKILNYVNKSI